MITIETWQSGADKDAQERLRDLVTKLDYSKDFKYFQRCFEHPHEGRVILVASRDNALVGLCVINFAPLYPLFKRLHIPEIQDLNVLTPVRGQGVGAALVAAAENLVRERGHTQIGIGVGLTSNYGAAQRLYTKLSYVPDGAGISYDGQVVRAGEMRPADDLLCLYLVKEL